MTTRNTIVVVSLRGGADGLNIVVPYRDEHYHAARPTIAIPRPGTGGACAIELDGRFALHPSLAPIYRLYERGMLAIVHAVGWPGESHSHFEITDEIEAGQAGSSRPRSGWLARCLALRTERARGPLTALAFASTLPRLLDGEPGVLTTRSLPKHLVAQEPDVDRRLKMVIRALYRDDPLLGPVATRALDSWEAIRESLEGVLESTATSRYPRTEFGEQFRSVEAVVRAGVGLEAASLELHGWDTHVVQGSVSGGMADRLGELAGALAAFAESEAELLERTTVVVTTEFGRRVAENGGAGTDHGCGTVMLLLGARVRGGRVFGDWPGLGEDTLSGPGDLAATSDVRDVLSELVAAEFGEKAVSVAFPAFRVGKEIRLHCVMSPSDFPPTLSSGRASCEDGRRDPMPVHCLRTRMRREDPRTDAQVAADVLAGDTESFAILVDRHQRRVFNIVLRMVANRSDAEDLSQEIFCKLFQQLDRYDPAFPLENWLVRITTNHCLNWLDRKRVRTIPLEIGPPGPRAIAEPRDLTPLPIDRAEESETRALIFAALQKLPANLRLVFILKYMEDYTAEEVAAMVDVPRNTAETWIFRAREALRTELEKRLSGHAGGPESKRR